MAFFVILAVVGTNNTAEALTTTTPFPDLKAEAVAVIDATTGELLFEQNKDVKMFPASTTKLMTALLAAENLNMAGEIVIDKETDAVGEATMNLKEGEILTVENILEGLLLVSGNDAAVAIAKAVSGNVTDFAVLMNEKAAELGAKNTHFSNPNGLHDDTHYVTAYDLALIAKAALANPTLRKIVGQAHHTIPATNLTPERVYNSTNQLLRATPYKYEGANGMKTGYTSEAGNCLVASAKRGETEIISVVLKSSELGRFADSTILLDYAFENYKTVMPLKAGADLGMAKVKRGAESKVKVIAKSDVAVTIPINASPDLITTELILDETVKAPIKKGQKMGTVEIYQVGETVGSVDAVAVKSIGEGGVLSIFGIGNKTAWIIKIVLLAALVIFIAVLWIYIILKRKEVRRKKQRKLERARARKSPQEEAWDAWMRDKEKYGKPRR